MMATALLLAAIGAEQIGTDTTSRAWAAQAERPTDAMGPGSVARRLDQLGSVDDRDAGDLSTVLEADRSADEEFVHVFTAPADLAVESRGATRYRIDEPLTYTVVVTNNGPASARDTQLRVSFSKGAAYQVAVPSQGTCASLDAVVTCDIGSIPNRGAATVEIQVTPLVAYSLTSTAEVTGTGPDPDRANNRATHTAQNSGEPIVICPPGDPV
jgi:uncharacterized repeat protein (TIGR01451 family)